MKFLKPVFANWAYVVCSRCLDEQADVVFENTAAVAAKATDVYANANVADIVDSI